MSRLLPGHRGPMSENMRLRIEAGEKDARIAALEAQKRDLEGIIAKQESELDDSRYERRVLEALVAAEHEARVKAEKQVADLAARYEAERK